MDMTTATDISPPAAPTPVTSPGQAADVAARKAAKTDAAEKKTAEDAAAVTAPAVTEQAARDGGKEAAEKKTSAAGAHAARTDAAESAAAPDAAPAKPALDLSKKTKGEKAYNCIQFLVGKVFIMAFTAVVAFSAKYGKRNYYESKEAILPNPFKKGEKAKLVIPNPFKRLDDFFEENVGKSADICAKALADNARPTQAKWLGVFGRSFANTMVLFHGGNIFSPFMKKIENSKNKIVNYVNKRWSPHEYEAGHARTKDEPEQTWADILKGRLTAWFIVFTSFTSAYILIGKDKRKGGTGKYWFDVIEDGFGRSLANVRRRIKGEELIPKQSEVRDLKESTNQTHNEMAKDSWNRFGQITAIDFFATSAAILIWNFVSRRSAKKKKAQDFQAAETPGDAVVMEANRIVNEAKQESPAAETLTAHAAKETARREQPANTKMEMAFA